MSNQYGHVQLPKLTKSVAENVIAGALRIEPHRLNFVKLTDSTREIKHACVPTGVVPLQLRTIPYGVTTIEFAFCGSCGKVLYYFES